MVSFPSQTGSSVRVLPFYFMGGSMPVERMKSKQSDLPGPANTTWAIFLISVLGLFLEMLLIRWIGTEIRIFAYLQNIILVVCFLGLGLGCFTSRQPVRFRQMLVPLFVLMLMMAVPLIRSGLGTISELLSVLGDLVIWYSVPNDTFWTSLLYVALGLGLACLVLILIVDIFVPIGRLLGRLMDNHPKTILAYSVNIGGSLVGTWLFVIISFFYQPPLTWFVILAILLFSFLNRRGLHWKMNLTLLLGALVLSWFTGLEPHSLDVVWSPYQKLVLSTFNGDELPGENYEITVNNVGYQSMSDLSEAHMTLHPETYPPEMIGLSQYDIPLLLHHNPQTYLIVGAGAGNDAAGGLRHEVGEITAVEIDPAIISMGSRYHPERPYSSPAVQLVIDDARSFFATSDRSFDVIVFGLLDSHTTTAMTNARLDHYVYTRESIEQAKSLLAPGGIIVLSFEAQKPYIADRMATVLRDVFHEEPIVFRIPRTALGWGGVMFVAGDLATATKQISQNPRLAAYIDWLQQEYPVSLAYTTKVTTDDWPYVYLETPKIPILYYLMAGLMALIFIRSYRRWRASGLLTRWGRPHWHFFFLGAAFLLLEVQTISKASVVLGNTWQVNAVIVSGVLAMALFANLVVHKFPTVPLVRVSIVLIVICLTLYFVDLAQFAFLPYFTKAVIVGGLTTMPMLFSGIIFTRSLTAVSEKDEALGANMIGALVGALLQSVTFVIGIKALLLVVAGLYGLSLLTLPSAVSKEHIY
jgi:spermidine synthase